MTPKVTVTLFAEQDPDAREPEWRESQLLACNRNAAAPCWGPAAPGALWHDHFERMLAQGVDKAATEPGARDWILARLTEATLAVTQTPR